MNNLTKQSDELISQLKKQLSVKRFNHTMGVSESAVRLARQYGADADKAELSALLHDFAREFDNTTMLQMCKKYSIVPDDVETSVPDLLHGKLAAAMALDVFGVSDTEVINAVRYHTTGRKNMTLMDKIIFIADMIEPGRDFPGVERLRELAFQDLNASVVAGLNSTIRFVLERGMLIHPSSVEARNYLLMLP